jgi:hypothetical protein
MSPSTQPLRIAFGEFPSWEKAIRANLDPRYTPFFVDLSRARLSDFDAIIPLQLRHYPPLARHPRLRGAKFFHPSSAAISVCDDKLQLAKFLMAKGYANLVPSLRPPGPPYPYIWKRRRGWWGIHCHIVNSPRDDLKLNLNDHDWFAQAVVPGEVEYATHVLRVGGQIRYVSTFVHTMATSALVNGANDTPLNSTFTRSCPHLDLFADILAHLDFEGTACIDYKIFGGQPLLFEINPRFGGSLCADITAYLDAYLGALTHQTPPHRLRSTLMEIPRKVLARLRG